MKTKYVFHGLVYSHINFHDNQTMRTVITIIKNWRWGEKEKEPFYFRKSKKGTRKETGGPSYTLGST